MNRDQSTPAVVAPIRLLLADDHHVVRRGIAGLLNGEPGLRVVAEAADGHAAVAMWQKHRPDVALLDLRMPGLDGVQATRAIRTEAAEARVIVLTTYDHDEGIFAAVRAGARAYLLKDVRPAKPALRPLCPPAWPRGSVRRS